MRPDQIESFSHYQHLKILQQRFIKLKKEEEVKDRAGDKEEVLIHLIQMTNW